ncbi:MAG: ribose-phosphate diphosphokinase [Pseudomonadota bacterium]
MPLLTFSDYHASGRALASELAMVAAEVAIHRFPDGESQVRLPSLAGGRPNEPLVVCRSLDRPNDKLVELLLLARTARAEGWSRLVLVAPYLCYMRQDAAFHSGEAVSQRIIGAFLADLFDEVITVDPHLHRVHYLEQAVPADRAVALSAAEPLRAYLAERLPDAVVVGPDEESEQWARAVAEPLGMDWLVGKKTRRGDRDVVVELPEDGLSGRTALLLDDVASSGQTLARAAEAARAAGAVDVHALVTHALFAEGAEEALRSAGISTLHSTDSIAHPSNAIALAPLLAGAVRDGLSAD